MSKQPKREYRVWTKNFDGGLSIMNDWATRSECVRLMIGRWGFRPGFAFISKCEDGKTFKRYNGG